MQSAALGKLLLFLRLFLCQPGGEGGLLALLCLPASRDCREATLRERGIWEWWQRCFVAQRDPICRRHSFVQWTANGWESECMCWGPLPGPGQPLCPALCVSVYSVHCSLAHTLGCPPETQQHWVVLSKEVWQQSEGLRPWSPHMAPGPRQQVLLGTGGG